MIYKLVNWHLDGRFSFGFRLILGLDQDFLPTVGQLQVILNLATVVAVGAHAFKTSGWSWV